MDTSEPHGKVNRDRRRLLGVAVAGAAAATALPMLGTAQAAHAAVPSGRAQFGPLRQVKAGVLNTGYVEAGPSDGCPVILMHGFPYDIHSYVEVVPLLVAEGYRVIVPYFAATARRRSCRPPRRATSTRPRSRLTSSP